jgi:hypothetical protein
MVGGSGRQLIHDGRREPTLQLQLQLRSIRFREGKSQPPCLQPESKNGKLLGNSSLAGHVENVTHEREAP